MKKILIRLILSLGSFFLLDLYTSNYLNVYYFFYFRLDEFHLIENELDIFYFKETIRFYLGSFFHPRVFEEMFNPGNFLIRIRIQQENVVSVDIIPKDFSLLKKNYHFFYGSCHIHMYYFTNQTVFHCLNDSFESLLQELKYFLGTESYSNFKGRYTDYSFIQCFNIRHYMWNIFCKYFLIYPNELSTVCFFFNRDHLLFFVRTSLYKYCLRFVLNQINIDFFFRKLFGGPFV